MENNTSDQSNYIRGVVESILFVNEKPITVEQVRKVIKSVTPAEIKKVILALQEEYNDKQAGMNIVEIAGGYQMLSNPDYASYLREFYKTKHKEKLSRPALETMAIVAYKEPVTRADIEMIRGVNSDGVVAHLLNKELIKVLGKKDVPGRPFIYGVTKQFLEYFGLKSLEDLPKLEEFADLLPAEDKEEGEIKNLNISLEEASAPSKTRLEDDPNYPKIEPSGEGNEEGVESEGGEASEESKAEGEEQPEAEEAPQEEQQEEAAPQQPEATNETAVETKEEVQTQTVTEKAEEFIEEKEDEPK